MATDKPDFVQVQLTQAGEDLAQGHPLTISGPRRSLTFTPGQSTRVERSFEWAWLQDHAVDGKILFEIVPALPTLVPVPAQRPVPVAVSAAVPAKAPTPAADANTPSTSADSADPASKEQTAK
jgi:hypothetical protein